MSRVSHSILKMSLSDEEDDVWELLKQNKVIVPEGIRRILDDPDLQGVQALAIELANNWIRLKITYVTY